MEVHVYLHTDGGFPNIHKNSVPVFADGNTILQIRNEETDDVTREYESHKVFRVDILMETE